MNTIFVQIASYKDPQLIPTLKDLITRSKDPTNLKITVAWQHGEEETTDIFLDAGFDITGFTTSDKCEFDIISAAYNGCQLQLIDIHYYKTNGACWARNLIQQFYNNEKYTLQLDSHHRFVDHWDQICIDMLESLRGISPKPLLTAYIPSFNPDNDPQERVMTPWKMDFDRFIPEGAVFFIPSSIDEWKELTQPLRARFYSAHFAFADGIFANEVQHDPEYFFHGEEISIAARAYTHGYDLYHPHKVIAWHEYTRKNRTKIWDEHTTTNKNKGRVKLDWVERNNICHRRNRILFSMDGEDISSINFGKYGFGTKRSLRDYEEYAGISFKYRGVQQITLDRKEPPLIPTKYSEEEWKNSFTKSHDLHILIHKSELDQTVDDYDFWYVGCHDAQGEVFRKDMVDHEIKKHLGNEWVDSRLIFLSNRQPTTYTVWPHSKSKGWMNKIDKKC